MKDFSEIFLEKFTRPKSGCWEWAGSINNSGYGSLTTNECRVLAHRLMYTLYYGVDPKKKYVLHLCDNPKCVRPNHLRLGTQSENLKESVKKNRHFESKKVSCPRGHQYDKENTYISPKGGRVCKICKRKLGLNYYYNNKKGRGNE